MTTFLEFEKPVAELKPRMADLRDSADDGSIDMAAEVERLEAKAERQLRDLYARLTPWQRTQVARHPERPHFKDYAAALIADFTPLAGDRNFGEDAAITGGLGRFRGRPVVVMGQEKGNETTSRLRQNFGMAKTEGYRREIWLMKLGDQIGLPVITLVANEDAFPG